MSFVAKPPQIDQAPAPETTVINDGFFPDIEPAAVREAARVPTSISAGRLRAAILGAIMAAEIDLRSWAADRQAEGFATLAAVPAAQLDGQSVQVVRYTRAIELLTKAELIDRHRDFDTTGAGDRKADDLDLSLDDLRRDAIGAIRDILGKGRTVVDLI